MEKDGFVVQISRLRILDWVYLRSKGVDVRLSKEAEDFYRDVEKYKEGKL